MGNVERVSSGRSRMGHGMTVRVVRGRPVPVDVLLLLLTASGLLAIPTVIPVTFSHSLPTLAFPFPLPFAISLSSPLAITFPLPLLFSLTGVDFGPVVGFTFSLCGSSSTSGWSAPTCCSSSSHHR